jgi:hypothetical protein
VTVLRVLLLTLRLLAHRGDDDLAYRTDLSVAIAAVTDDEHEQNLLASIARWESFYRRDVGECQKKGGAGEVTAFQILARNDAERALLCVSLEGDARIALGRIRESLAACASLPAPERLAVYARGRCSSVEGRRLSRVRWLP